MQQRLTLWDLQEWRMVVQDLLSAMEAHDIAHFVEAGHPENYEACVAASDALQVAQIRARAMLERTDEPDEKPTCTCLSISRDPLCVYHGSGFIACPRCGATRPCFIHGDKAYQERVGGNER